MSIVRLKRPIRRLPYKGKLGDPEGAYPVEVVDMDDTMVRRWHEHVQPLIDAQYRPWSPGSDERWVRADVHWNWWKIRAYAGCHNFAARWPGNQSGKAVACCLTLAGEEADWVPVGMLTVVPRFRCTVDGANRDRSFVWYLSDAPEEHYRKLRIEPMQGVARALIDTALQARIDLGFDAAALLHAAPEGGGKLQKFYEKACGMTRVVGGSERISALRAMRPGEYFKMDGRAAQAFCSRHDIYRI
jgi:hypothetical protein